MPLFPRRLRLTPPSLALPLTALLISTALAQSAPPDSSSSPASGATGSTDVLPTVESNVKRGDFMPYRQINEILSVLQTEGQGLFAPRLKLTTGKKGGPPPANAKLVLMDEERTIHIPVGAEGRFELPIFPAKEAREMELGSNLPKGESGINLGIDLTTPPDQLDLGTVRRIVKVAQRLRGELLPWYLRWLFPQIDGVMICSDQPAWSLDWRENGQLLTLPLTTEVGLREMYTPRDKPSRPCTSLSGLENWPDAARLQPPPGGNTKIHVKLRLKRAE